MTERYEEYLKSGEWKHLKGLKIKDAKRLTYSHEFIGWKDDQPNIQLHTLNSRRKSTTHDTIQKG